MARNIEIKASVENVESLIPAVASIANSGPVEIAQDDTFFRCDTGRLKLRAFSSDKGELIFYRRADRSGPKESFYIRSATSEPESLRESLSLAYGQVGRVRKLRTLFLVGRTRVHLDRVEGLGHFLELEVVLGDDESPESGVREAHELMGRLGIRPDQLIDSAYVDLLARRTVTRE
ncbi:adenylate cyclase [Variovorax sp. HW608]|uniref:class IV adenylate cyclase n=1 Tax=Variovorax sp. HW608 TaxID=1034889 RepID=UPI00081FE034|nr:class IV adenylate cyclase [Variovorax sp. HW608]SCK33089.1 adenylate cyclase [Variovorax sp. HW608]